MVHASSHADRPLPYVKPWSYRPGACDIVPHIFHFARRRVNNSVNSGTCGQFLDAESGIKGFDGRAGRPSAGALTVLDRTLSEVS
jgi:hypothetical protein